MKECKLTVEDIERAMAILKEAPKRSSIFNPFGVGTMDIDYRGNYRTNIPATNINPCAEIPFEQCMVKDISELLMESTENTFKNWFKNLNNEKLEGGNTMFNVNDEVIVVKNEYSQFENMEGVIKEVTKSNNGTTTYGVFIESLKVGHDLDGKCPFGQGWYFLEDEIDLLHKSKLCRMIEKDEELLKTFKQGDFKAKYEMRKNGALTFLTTEGRKVFVYKDGATAPLILNCISEDDRIMTLHLMEAFRILPMHTIADNKMKFYTQAESDKLETEMLPVEQPVEMPVAPVAKVYASEEELMADLGMI